MEHAGRNRSGRFFNFNGTAGIWRRSAIADAGGWQHDTLTEDMDLSYRAQLRGWRFVYLPEIASPAEPGVTFGAMQEAGENLVYLAGVQADGASLPPGMARLDVPAGDYAVFEFAFGQLGEAYPFIFGSWLPGSGYVQDARPLLERYGTDFCPDQPASPMQVRVPVRPRA